jgi:hypothetical protein
MNKEDSHKKLALCGCLGDSDSVGSVDAAEREFWFDETIANFRLCSLPGLTGHLEGVSKSGFIWKPYIQKFEGKDNANGNRAMR